MLNHVLKAGDRVRMKMNHDTRTWTTKNVPDGTLGTITGRHRVSGVIENRYPVSTFRQEGIYSIDGSIIVLWDEYPEDVDPTHPDIIRVSATDLEPADTFFEEYQKRLKDLWPVNLEDGSHNKDFCIIKEGYRLDNLERTDDLPETPFWELDIVGHEGRRYVIRSIDYFRWGEEKSHCYLMEEIDEHNVYLRNGSATVDPKELILIERGNLWKERHGEPLKFTSLELEIEFEIGMGRAVSLRNPTNGLYRWTEEEALQAIKDDIADGFKISSGMFGGSQYITVARFENRVLGEKIRKTTLSGFGL